MNADLRVSIHETLAIEMSPGFGTGFERDLGGNWFTVAASSGQSFETLEALNLGPSDFVPKLTVFENAGSVPYRPSGPSLLMVSAIDPVNLRQDVGSSLIDQSFMSSS